MFNNKLTKSFTTILVLFCVTALSNDYSKAIERLNSNKELYLSIAVESSSEIEKLSTLVSIGSIKGDTVFVYANQEQFSNLVSLTTFKYAVEPHPGERTDIVAAPCNSSSPFKYPSYDSLIAIVKSFANQNPDICTYYEVGKSVNGKIIPGLVLTNKKSTIPKPRVFFCGPPHGNELTGLMLNLKLYDTLISGFQKSDKRIVRILDSIEIWTITLLNPDGTYKGGNNTVVGAQRANANGVDLNRTHAAAPGCISEASSQPETKALQSFLKKAGNHFTLATDFHDGAQLSLIPWSGKTAKHPENDWYISAGNFVKSQAAGSFKEGVGQLYTLLNYNAPGCFHDFGAYYMKGMKAFCWELSSSQPPAESQLSSLWNIYKNSLLAFSEMSLLGVRGIIKDSITGDAIEDVKVSITSYDKDSSWVFSYSDGGFYRLLNEGTYVFSFEKNGYIKKEVTYTLSKENTSILSNISLLKQGTSVSHQTEDMSTLMFKISRINDRLIITSESHRYTIATIQIYDLQGNLLQTVNKKHVLEDIRIPSIGHSVYLIKVQSININDCTKRELIIKYNPFNN